MALPMKRSSQRRDALNQMEGVYRNPFLFLCLIGLLALLAACAAKPPVPPLPPPSPPPLAPQPLQAKLPLLGYAVQVGAFAQVDRAFALCSALIKQGLPAYYFRGDKGLYRVRFGNFPTYDQAVARARQGQEDRLIAEYLIISPESYPVRRYRGQEEAIRRELALVAQQFVGVPYRWGGASPVLGFDCSGLTRMVYQLIGLDMPRSSRDQFRQGEPRDREHLRPGDLLFFSTDGSGQVSHVGLYLGDDLFIHAPSRGKTVARAKLSSAYFGQCYLGARAYFSSPQASSPPP